MSILDNNNLAIASIRENIISESLNSVHEIKLVCTETNNLKYISVNIKLASEANPCKIRFIGNNRDGSTIDLIVYDVYGNIYNNANKSGQYFVDASNVDTVSIYNNIAVDTTASFSIQQLAIRPTAFDLRPIQSIVDENITMTAGQTEINKCFTSTILNYFRFIVVYVRYKGVSSQYKLIKLTIKTEFCNVQSFADYPKRTDYDAEKENCYALDTEWLPVKGKSLFTIIGVTSAEAGDIAHLEIRGIR